MASMPSWSGKDVVEFDEVDDMEGMPGTCDWGDCDEEAVAFRLDDGKSILYYGKSVGYLPVCERHRTED